VKPRVIIYCDGACSPNPGIGGWGAVLLGEGNRRRELSGAEPDSTNQRMEMTAAIKALRVLERPCDVTVYTDSKYVQNAFRLGWLERWPKNGWRNSERKPVKNKDLWLELVELTSVHRVEWNWVPGHAGVKENECCDALAVAARERLRDAGGK
jgi:ribonuclease HI